MLSIVNYGGYVAAAATLCVTPGIDTVYILMRTIAGGRREGLASALGINTGLVVHTVLVAAGLSLVLAASPVAFNVIKIAGALYLAVMGVRSILAKGGGSFAQLAAGEKGEAAETAPSAAAGAGDADGPADAGADGVAAQAAAGRVNGIAAQADAGRADALHGTPVPAKADARGPWRTYAQGVLTNVLNPKIILFFLALLPQFIAVPNEHGPLPFLALGLTYAALSTAWTVVIVLIAAPFAKLLSRSARAGRVAGVVSGVVYVILGAMILLTE